ncbi:hypothetical protein [Dactylosporangium sp. CA-092794]|uniref:hypothetical protein n=1 Tax=Dactylosporangium sp. CA-092794 TaxID=3239929 RepID=UPI003D8B2803
MHEQTWYCPRCGALLDERSFIGEWWSASATNLAIWCVRCGWEGVIAEEGRVTAFEFESAEGPAT